MNFKSYLMHLDIKRGILNPQNLQFTTEDNGTCKLQFKLLVDKITPYDLTGCLVRLVTKSSGEMPNQQDCIIEDAAEGLTSITLMQSMFKNGGNYLAELQIYNASNQTIRLTAPRFSYRVENSLMDDNTAQADPNFSILQNMIVNVTNADRVSTEALQVANQAKTIVDVLVPQANDASTKAQEALDRAESVVTQEELANKIKMGDKEANFNFIERKIERDGLINLGSNVNNIFTLMGSFQDVSINTVLVQKTSGQTGFWFETSSLGSLRVRFYTSDGNTSTLTFRDKLGKSIEVNNGLKYGVTLIVNENIMVCVVGSIVYELANPLPVTAFINSSLTYLQKFSAYCLYSRVLYTSEIQFNSQVLYNMPSINSLAVTDKDGASKNFILSTDARHTIMRDGRNLDEFAYECLDWQEFNSSDGSPITIDNGKKAWVKSGEILGQTVKNYVEFDMANSIISSGNKRRLVLKEASMQMGEYVIKFSVSSIVGVSFPMKARIVNKNGDFAYITIATINKNGIYEYKLNWLETYSKIECIYCDDRIFDDSNISFKIDYICIVPFADKNKVTSHIPFGLSSTQAIINNNGNSYQIYEPTIQGKTSVLQPDGSYANTGLIPSIEGLPPLKDGDILDLATRAITFANKTTKQLTIEEIKGYWKYRKVISCGDTATKKDVFELKDDGSGIWTINTKDADDGSGRVDLSTPIVQYVDKSIMPTVPIQQTNVLSVGEAVKASEFKVTVPINKVKTLEDRLAALEAKTNTMAVNVPYVEETLKHSKNKIEEVICNV